MVKVLIIEDEREALEGVKRIMEPLEASVARAFFCDHAATALEVIEEHRPELIVTDIILPDMTGLDLLEQVQRDDYKPKIMIVSGFDNFEYAKRGLKLGAIDYFLKPFDTEQFRRKITACIAWIEEEERERLDHHRAVELAHLGTRSMRDVFLLGLCLQPTPLQEHILHRLRIWQLDWIAAEPYQVIALTVKQAETAVSEKEEDLLAFAIGNIVDELLQAYPPAVTFINARKYWIILCPPSAVEALVPTVSGEIMRCQNIHVRMGISERTESFQALHGAYRQAVDCLRAALLSKDRDVYFFDQLRTHTLSRDEEIAESMVDAIEVRDEEAIREAADRFVRHLVMKSRATRPGDISQRCIDWVRELQEALRKRSGQPIGEIPVALWDEMDECGSMDDLGLTIARYLISLSLQLKAINKNSIVEQAMKLIHQQFTEDLSLQRLAEELSIHPVWLSQLFKKEVGTGFLDYVVDLRIQKAKELLRHSNLKIYEIAESVGYQDTHHFGRLFKKKAGLTPKEFRYGR